jgi:hypothetical protein
MKQLTLIIVVLVSASVSAFARIGDTKQQIEARYGKSIGTLSMGDEHYRSSGLDITVAYIDGVSQSEFFMKQDGSELSENEIAVLLEANVGGSKWIEDPSARLTGNLGWKLESGGRIAGYSHRSKALMIVADLAAKVFTQRKAAAAKEKLKGF